MKKKVVDESEIKEGEYHPSADYAMKWFREYQQNFSKYSIMRESIASVALSGNRLAEICYGTLTRLEEGKHVSDRYLLGLCWFLRDTDDKI